MRLWLFRKHNCAAEGHVWRTLRRRGFRKANRLGKDEIGVFHFRCIAHECEQERTICRKCPEETNWVETWGQCIQTFTCGPDMMRRLDKGEFV